MSVVCNVEIKLLFTHFLCSLVFRFANYNVLRCYALCEDLQNTSFGLTPYELPLVVDDGNG